MVRYRSFLFLLTAIMVAVVGIFFNRLGGELAIPVQELSKPFEKVIKETPASVEVSSTSAKIDEPFSSFKLLAPNIEKNKGNKATVGITEQDAVSKSEPPINTNTIPSDGAHLPLMIRWSNWQTDLGPALVYARERDLAGMLQMEGPVKKMLMVASYDEAERLMTRADDLRMAGVTIVGLNTENGPGMTPHEEMDTLDNPDPNVNVVARVALLATENGFDVIWGPVRETADLVNDAAIRTMMKAGLRGLALQEQKFIEVQPSQMRLAEVNRTRERYLRLAQEQAIEDFEFHVQIMHQRCPNLNNCAAFVVGLEKIPVDSIAIWSNGPIPLGFIAAIRHY